jgi:Carboxypeptidase regulatory-like domain/TonB dependent receptor-like, beta-barrel
MDRFVRGFVYLFIAVGVVLVTVSSVSAQSANRISGKITDQQGGVLPGATVVAHHAETGIDTSTVSNAAGIYVFPSLPAGSYSVEMSLSGFTNYRREGLLLLTGQSLTVDATLDVAGVEETVTVSGESPMIATQESSVRGVVENIQIENVPINTRDTQNLALLVPGARRANQYDPTKARVPMVSFGTMSSGRGQLYTIDGGDNTDDVVGGLLQQVSMDSVQEFEVVTARLTAEYSRAGGGAIRIITKSGTNEFRGSVFEFFRDKALNAETEAEKRAGTGKGPFRRHQFGGNIGGPIVKDKAFFFFTYERIQEDVSDSLFLPSDVQSLYDPAFLSAHGGLGTIEQPFRRNYLTAKYTQQVNANNRLDVRYAYENNSRDGDLIGTGRTNNATRDYAAIQTNNFWSILARFQTVVGANGFNEAVFQGTDFVNVIQGVTQPSYTELGAPTLTFPTLVVGTNPSAPQSTLQRKYQFRDNFSWTLDTHTFKFGADVLRASEAAVDLAVFRGHGSFTYANDGDPLDQAVQFTQFAPFKPANVPNTAVGFYGQDDWRVSDALTLNLGVRYDVEIGALSNAAYGDSGEFLLTQPGSPFLGQGSCVSGTRGPGCIADDKNNVAPRLGFTWDVGAKGTTVVRGGFGIFYDKVIGLSTLFTQLDAGGVQFVFLIDPPFGPDNQPSLDELLAGGAIPLSFDETPVPGFQNPRSNQFSIGASHQFTPTVALDADFIYAKDHNRNKESDVNEMTVANDPTSRLFYPTRQGGLLIEESRGENEYKGLQLSLRKRFSNRVQFVANYTLSEASGFGGLGISATEFQAECRTCIGNARDVGPLQNDARHLFVGSGVFALPADFQFSAILTLESGRAITALSSQDLNGNGQIADFAPGPNGEPAGRGNFRGDKTSVLDLRVVKFFRFGGGRDLQVMFEGFNAFNRHNEGRELESTFESPNFGQWNGTTEPGLNQFQAQLGIRFTF